MTRALAGCSEFPLIPKTFEYGKAFEQWIILEIHRFIRIFEKEWKLSYVTTKDGAEVDLVIDMGKGYGTKQRWALEIKSSEEVDPKKVSLFERLAQDVLSAQLLFVSQDPTPQRYGSVECLFWRDALDRIFKESTINT